MSESAKPRKPRKLSSHSCDMCRQRKVRCNGPDMPGNQCSHCLAFKEPCTYARPVGRRGRKNKLVEELTAKVAALEAKLRVLSVCSLCSQPLESTFDLRRPGRNPKSDAVSRGYSRGADEEDAALDTLTEQIKQWKISTGFSQCKTRFFGSHSNATLVGHVLQVKEKSVGRPLMKNPQLRRPIYWEQFPWEDEYYSQRTPYIFPPHDEMTKLVNLYFENVHPTFPILHRDAFRQKMAEGLHRTDACFGALGMVVLALGSRYSDDPRVMSNGSTLSSGWRFIAQVQHLPAASESTVYHAQFFCLMTLWSMGGSTPIMTWVYLGLGIRCIQYHNRYFCLRGAVSKFEDELWNRAFWSIFVLDGLLSWFIGRPPTINVEEYNVDPPLEVDDEYWDKGFVQPLGMPSVLSFFACFVRLFEILGKALHWTCASKRMKTRMGWDTVEREQEFVAELDSLMNDFQDTVPAHLRWDPNGQGTFFDQATVLHVTYYWLQITVHRPHMLRQTSLAGPSLSICSTAARSALSVVDIWTSRTQRVAPSLLQIATFISAVILLLKIFATKRARGSLLDVDKDKDMAQVRAAMRVLKVCEARWQSAGRQWELLQELQYLDGAPVLPETCLSDAAVANTTRSEVQEHPQAPVIHDFACEGFRPGASIEQLLSETDTRATSNEWEPADNELMSQWLAAPADFIRSIDGQWDLYVEKVAGMNTMHMSS